MRGDQGQDERGRGPREPHDRAAGVLDLGHNFLPGIGVNDPQGHKAVAKTPPPQPVEPMLESWHDSPVQCAKLTLCQTRAALVLGDQRTVIKFLFHDRKSRRGDLAMQYAYANVDGSEIVDGTTLEEQYYLTRHPIVGTQLAIAAVRLAVNLEQIFTSNL